MFTQKPTIIAAIQAVTEINHSWFATNNFQINQTKHFGGYSSLLEAVRGHKLRKIAS